MGGKLPPHSWRRSRFTSAQMSTFSEGGEKEGPFLKKNLFPSLSTLAKVPFCGLSSGSLYYCHYGAAG